MEAYIERMVEEKRELDEKIVKLIAFRYSKKGDELLSEYQKNMMDRQFTYMSGYSRVLGDRIFNEKVNTGEITPDATYAD